jgi:hypothetical protein
MTAPQSPRPPSGKIMQAVLIEGVLLALGVALYVMTGHMYWIIGAFFVGSAAMFLLVILPSLKRARDK